jgi:hypothetical protein
VTINAKQYSFLFDTGSSGSIFDTSLQELLVPTGRTARLNGHLSAPIHLAPPAEISNTGIRLPSELLCLDLRLFRYASGHDIRVILGMDVLRGFVWRINFDTGRLSILKPGSPADPSSLKISFSSDNRPEIDLTAGGQPLTCLLDTGFVGSVNGGLSSSTFDALLKRRELVSCGGSLVAATIDGATTSRVAALNLLVVASYRQQGLLFRKSDTNVLGLGYLSRYSVTLDFPNGAIKLDPGSHFDEAPRFDLSGITMINALGAIRVQHLADDGPARRAGIAVGDRILEINGSNADDLGLFRVRRMLSEPGEPARLLIERNNAVSQYLVQLEKRGSQAAKRK